MGQHTWFHKSADLYFKERQLWESIDRSDDGEEYLDPDDYWRVSNEAEDIHKENDAGYHDLFRTNKRMEGSTEYINDALFSREECDEWLDENEHSGLNRKLLDEFWDKYPNGVIDFG